MVDGVMQRGRAVAAGILVLLLVRGLASPAHAQTPTAAAGEDAARARARDYFRAGRAHQEAGDFDLAIAEYEAGHALVRLPEFLFNIAQCHRAKGAKAKAVEYYRRYLAAAPEGRGAADARIHIVELTGQIERDGAEAERNLGDPERARRAVPPGDQDASGPGAETSASGPEILAPEWGVPPPHPPAPDRRPAEQVLVYALAGYGLYPGSSGGVPGWLLSPLGVRVRGSLGMIDVRLVDIVFLEELNALGNPQTGGCLIPGRVSFLRSSPAFGAVRFHGGLSAGVGFVQLTVPPNHESGRYASHWSFFTGARGGFELRLSDLDFVVQAELGLVPVTTADVGGTGLFAHVTVGFVIRSFGP